MNIFSHVYVILRQYRFKVLSIENMKNKFAFSQGIETKIVENDGQSEDTPHIAEQCEFCFTNQNISGDVLSIREIEKVTYQTARIKSQHYEIFVLEREVDNASPRGPPALV